MNSIAFYFLLFYSVGALCTDTMTVEKFSEEDFLKTISLLSLPKGWKVPKIYPDSPCRKEGQSLYAVEADFDGDKNKDVAVLLANETGKGMGLWIATHISGSWQQVASTGGKDGLGDLGVSLIEPGKYKTACAKGYGDPCKADELAELTLTRPAISFFTCESADSIIYWNDEKKLFEQIWISD